ncbi:MAG TPA: hypothetical protein VLK34_04405 [Nocardioidaceae bacterium]|nr:hypothetical protein [Nocardioidaceae bacterium]
MSDRTAAALADEQVALVRDDPRGRLALLRRLYELPSDVDRGYLPFRRAASAFMTWQLRRGLLEPESSPTPGSPWWRALNESLLRDTAEARALAFGRPGEPRTAGVTATLDFISDPSARSWYRAHNTSIASAYLVHDELACDEGRVERFFLNLVLVRVMYAHALVAAPRLALGWLAPLGRLVGDPRVGMTGTFLSLSRVLPDRYPLDDDLGASVRAEHRVGRLLDVGVIVPRLEQLYDWSADELGLPGLSGLLARPGAVPCYAWDPREAHVWHPSPSGLVRTARRAFPLSKGSTRRR